MKCDELLVCEVRVVSNAPIAVGPNKSELALVLLKSTLCPKSKQTPVRIPGAPNKSFSSVYAEPDRGLEDSADRLSMGCACLCAVSSPTAGQLLPCLAKMSSSLGGGTKLLRWAGASCHRPCSALDAPATQSKSNSDIIHSRDDIVGIILG